MTELTASPHDVMRRTIAKLDPDAVLQVVDSLQFQGAKVSAVVAVPLRSLQKKRDVAAFAAGAPIDAVSGLLELLAMESLDKVIEALGDHSETPTYEQLSDAVTSLRGSELNDDQIVAVMGFAIGNEFPAAPHCRRILAEDEALALPEIEITIGQASLLSPKVVDESVREQRRLRREQEKARKLARAAKAKASQGSRAKPEKKKPVTPTPPPVPSSASSLLVVTRRAVTLTPAEATLFDPHHSLAGSVVTTEVPFDAVDPDIPEQQSKVRPAVVLAASEQGLLVRGIYSNPSPSRRVFSPWRRLGLDHVSYVDDARNAVAADTEVTRLGILSDEEWNSLF